MKFPSITKTYGSRRVLDIPALELEEGVIHAVIGSNGSGKSTLARILAGVLKPDGGGVPWAGRVGYMPQRSYPFRMSVLRNLQLTGAGRDRAMEQLQAFGLEGLARQSAKGLSGGETARLAMARLLMEDYPFLILDEPTAAMDVAATLLSEELLLQYQARTGGSPASSSSSRMGAWQSRERPGRCSPTPAAQIPGPSWIFMPSERRPERERESGQRRFRKTEKT